jgi:hypothetical protein
VSALLKLLTVLASTLSFPAMAQMPGWSDFDRQEYLEQPMRVVERLRRGSTVTEKKFEEETLKLIEREKKGRGPNTKSYLELAMASPTPNYLLTLSEIQLKEYFINKPPKYRPKNTDFWIKSHADLYASILAGNAVVSQLDEKQLATVQQEKICAEKYLATKKFDKTCRPVRIILSRNKLNQ